MAWQSWQGRIGQLPKVLAGPILRRVEPSSVTVWLALREQATVTLRVFVSDPNEPSALVGTRATTKLAKHVHVVAVTADTGPALAPGTVYRYNAYLDMAGAPTDDLQSPGVLRQGNIGPASLGCGDFPLPTFSLPPADLNQLRLLHGSCRKPHGAGEDALRELAAMIDESAALPLQRPHQLFLTGDQIYADDVADALLLMVIDAGFALGFEPEELPIFAGGLPPPPGDRELDLEEAGLTGARTIADAGHMKSHLTTFAEYSVMYLMTLSEVLWPAEFPNYQDVYDRNPPRTGRRRRDDRSCFDRETDKVAIFKRDIASARRALANVPTYMIFDDHEITDDWNMDRAWVNASVGNALFQRVLQNGISAYAVFQAWGNDPAQFQTNARGGQLLNAIQTWAAAPNTVSHAVDLRARLGMPTGAIPSNQASYPRSDLLAVSWHYDISGPSHRVIVLDTRTQRAYAAGAHDHPGLLNATAVAAQTASLETNPLNDDQVLVVISPAPLVGNPTIELVQGIPRRVGLPYLLDAEFWIGSELPFQRFLARIATSAGRIVILSGDVHYGYSARYRYSAQTPFGASASSPSEAVLAQFTCSAFKNEGFPGTSLHEDGRIGTDTIGVGPGLPEVVSYCWNNAEGARRNIGSVSTGRGPALVWRSRNPIVYDKVFGFTPNAPDWSLKLKFFRSDQDRVPNPPPTPVPTPGGDPSAELEATLTTGANHLNYQTRVSSGANAVGRNNLGEITFVWPAGDAKVAVHRLFWALGENAPLPLSRFRIPMSLAQETF